MAALIVALVVVLRYEPQASYRRRERTVSGLLGEHPSHYSRSPALWNAAYRDLGLDAAYAPFDVPPNRLAAATPGAHWA